MPLIDYPVYIYIIGHLQIWEEIPRLITYSLHHEKMSSCFRSCRLKRYYQSCFAKQSSSDHNLTVLLERPHAVAYT